MPSGDLVCIITIESRVYCWKRPRAEKVTSITFVKGSSMASLLGTINLLVQADTTITSRPVLVEFDVGAPLTVDMINPAATFVVPTGATSGKATPTGSVNPVGTGPAGAAFPFAVPSQATAPPAEVITSVTFSPGA